MESEESNETVAPTQATEGKEEVSPLRRACTVQPEDAQREAGSAYGVASVDWTKANWSLPQLQRLSELSELSAHDLPSAAIAELDKDSDNRLRVEHLKTMPSALVSSQAASIPMDPNLQVKRGKDLSTLDSIEDMAAQPPVDKVSPHILQLKCLLGLSDLTTAKDARLQELVGHVAERYADDPSTVNLILKSNVKYTSVNKAALAADVHVTPVQSGGQHRRDDNKGFFDSDVVTYPTIRSAAEESWKVDRLLQAIDAAGKEERLAIEGGGGDAMADGKLRGQVDPSTSSVQPMASGEDAAGCVGDDDGSAAPKSMHDCGYQTWMQRHLEAACEEENLERLDDYLDELSQWKAKEYAVQERLRCLHEDGEPYCEQKAVQLQSPHRHRLTNTSTTRTEAGVTADPLPIASSEASKST